MSEFDCTPRFGICEDCGKRRRVGRHYDDSSLAVQWLCVRCHCRKHHSARRVRTPYQHHPRTPSPAMLVRKEEMLELRKAGLNNLQIGNKFNLSRERIRQIIGNHRPFIRERLTQERENIISLRLERKSIKEISKAVCLPEGTIKSLDWLPRLPPAPMRHGTNNCYANRGCRCLACTAASNLRHQKYVAKKRADGFLGLEHGTRTTYQVGCRCDLCLEIGRASQRKNGNFCDRSEAMRRAWVTRRANQRKQP